MFRHAGRTSVAVFVEEHSLTVPAINIAKRWRKYHLSDVAEKCTTNEFTSDTTPHVYDKEMLIVAFLQFHMDYQDLINGSFLYC